MFCSCSDEISNVLPGSRQNHQMAKAVKQDSFDWENDDFMPTPPGTECIQVPWAGAGSILGTYGTDVVNDRKKSEGWELLYSSFTKDASLFSPNPYFILYNKYRGLMRLFYYTTSDFIANSSFVLDNFNVLSDNYSSTILNFADNSVVNGEAKRMSLTHIQPQPSDNSMPVSSHRWYMAQCELAYDPDIESIPYDQIMLNINFNYRNISSIKLEGSSVGKLKGTIGEQSTGEFNKAFDNLAKEGGKAVLTNVGYNLIKKSVDATGKNSLGISDVAFKWILKNLGQAATSSNKSVWKAGIGLLNSMLFGTKTSPTPIYATINTSMKATGSITNDGSLPSMPIVLMMPGTEIPSNAVGRIPLYNKPLGVFNIKGRPSINITHSVKKRIRHDDPYSPGSPIIETIESLSCGQPLDYSKCLIFNPEVKKVADINVINSEVFTMDKDGNIDGTDLYAHDYGEHGSPTESIPVVSYYYFVAIEVKPKDGSPSTIISKTFELNNIVKEVLEWLPEID